MNENLISAFSNPTRLQLIRCLSQKDKNVQQLIENCGLSQSAVSQHLQKLRKSGVVFCKKEGREVYYFLAYPQAARIAELMFELNKEVKS